MNGFGETDTDFRLQSRERVKTSPVSRPEAKGSPRPGTALMTTSSVLPVTGFAVNAIPAARATATDCTSTAIAGSWRLLLRELR